MPILKNAIKKMRQDQKSTVVNQSQRTRLKTVLSVAKKESTAVSISEAFSLLDRASKKGLIHPNKAARQKSQLSKLVVTAIETPTKTKAKAKKTTKKVK